MTDQSNIRKTISVDYIIGYVSYIFSIYIELFHFKKFYTCNIITSTNVRYRNYLLRLLASRYSRGVYVLPWSGVRAEACRVVCGILYGTNKRLGWPVQHRHGPRAFPYDRVGDVEGKADRNSARSKRVLRLEEGLWLTKVLFREAKELLVCKEGDHHVRGDADVVGQKAAVERQRPFLADDLAHAVERVLVRQCAVWVCLLILV